MSNEEEHEKLEDMVESPGEAEKAARTLEDAADSNATLEGYYSINETPPPEEVREQVDKEERKKD